MHNLYMTRDLEAQTMTQDKTVEEQLRSMEGDFDELANRLAALVDLHASDPALASHVEGLRAAQAKASRGAELLRRFRIGPVSTQHGN